MNEEKLKQNKLERTNLNKMRLMPIKESRETIKEKKKDNEVVIYVILGYE
jgi:hypothetical protein